MPQSLPSSLQEQLPEQLHCGSWLASDGITAINQADLIACIAGKPDSHRFWVVPQSLPSSLQEQLPEQFHCGSWLASDGITALNQADLIACIAGEPDPHRV